MSKRDTNQELVSDETATRDVGGAYGGKGGPMPTREEAQRDESFGERPDTATDPNKGGNATNHDAVSYAPSGATGEQRPMSGDVAEAGQTRTGNPETGPTDARDRSKEQDHGLGGQWTGETAPDVQARENSPVRGGEKNTEATDAF